MTRWLLLVVAFPTALNAQDKAVKTTFVSGDLGFVSASGNTNVTTLNIGEKIIVNTADKRIMFTQQFGALQSRSDGVINVQNYRALLRLDYGLGGRFYLFGLTGWDKNVPGGVRRRFEETIGILFKAITLPNDELGIEVGLSMFQQRNTVATAGTFEDNFTAGRAAAFYKRTVTKTAFFSQQMELIPNFEDSEDFRLNTESAFTALISTNLGVKLSYLIRYDNFPGLKPGSTTGERLVKTDRFLTAGITASY